MFRYKSTEIPNRKKKYKKIFKSANLAILLPCTWYFIKSKDFTNHDEIPNRKIQFKCKKECGWKLSVVYSWIFIFMSHFQHQILINLIRNSAHAAHACKLGHPPPPHIDMREYVCYAPIGIFPHVTSLGPILYSMVAIYTIIHDISKSL